MTALRCLFLALSCNFWLGLTPLMAAELLPTTPKYTCQNLLLGAKSGQPYYGTGFKIFARLINSRYSIQTENLDAILDKGAKHTLYLPQHTGLVDPMIMIRALGQATAVRPLMTEEMAPDTRMGSLVKKLVGGVNAFLVPSPAGKTGTSLVTSVMDELVNALKTGDNVMLYPAGTIQSSEQEQIANKAAVEYIVKAFPEVRIVLVRQRGLWGSSWTHGSPQSDPAKKIKSGELLARAFLTSLKTLVGNGFILTPKRPVTLEFLEPQDFPRTGTREEINSYMEKFYNDSTKPATRSFVKRYFWQRGPKVKVVEEKIDYRKPIKASGTSVSIELPQVDEKLLNALVQITKSVFPPETVITPDSNLQDLGIDSMNSVALDLEISSQFDVSLPENMEFGSLRDLGMSIAKEIEAKNNLTAGESKNVFTASKGWHANPSSNSAVSMKQAGTVTQAILLKAFAEPSKVIGEDQLRGALTYKDLVVRALALSSILKKQPGENLGLLLPATGGGPMIYLATHLAAKVPVYVNFTSAPDAIFNSLNNVGVEKIVTSRAVIEKLGQEYDMSKYMDRFIYLEDMVTRIKINAPLSMLRFSLFKKEIIKQAGQTKNAVILFTSGSSGNPKAVPLSHLNIMTNINDVMSIFKIVTSDRLLNFLPPFHSFGHLMQTLSLTLGVPAVAHTKPTDARTLANLIEAYKVTVAAGTPKFLADIALIASPGQLHSLRLMFTGAEALKPEQMQILKRAAPNAEILEGYGATELSPVVAVNPPGASKPGTVGKIMPSLEYRILDPVSFESVARGERGLLVASGDSVFTGYFNYTGASPFIEIDGRNYYNTGDIVTEDSEGYITILGRLGRFRKISGEMVSLPALENVIEKLIEPMRPKLADGSVYSGPLFAVESSGDSRPLILFTVVQISQPDVQRFLKEKGLSGAHSIYEVRVVDEIPMLGTGKTDYKSLQNILIKGEQ